MPAARLNAANIFRKVSEENGCVFRGEFPGRKRIPLPDVGQFDEALGWCLERHQSTLRGFRAWTQRSRSSAWFEFECDFDAVDFRLRFN